MGLNGNVLITDITDAKHMCLSPAINAKAIATLCYV